MLQIGIDLSVGFINDCMKTIYKGLCRNHNCILWNTDCFLFHFMKRTGFGTYYIDLQRRSIMPLPVVEKRTLRLFFCGFRLLFSIFCWGADSRLTGNVERDGPHAVKATGIRSQTHGTLPDWIAKVPGQYSRVLFKKKYQYCNLEILCYKYMSGIQNILE